MIFVACSRSCQCAGQHDEIDQVHCSPLSQQIARVSSHRTKFNGLDALHCLKKRCGWCCILGLMKRPVLGSRDRFSRRTLFATAVGAAISGALRRARADPVVVRVGYLRWLETRQTISLLDKPPPDNGLAGA